MAIHLTDRFDRALTYAAAVHAHQTRRGTAIPYISHLMIVAGLVLEHGGNEDQAIAALLHDAAEDAGRKGRVEDIRARFGEPVAEIVHGCTDTYASPKPPWHERKIAYLARLEDEPDSIRLVSAADKLANVRSIIQDYRQLGESLWPRFNPTRSQLVWYYRSLADVFNRLGPATVAGELEAAVRELERLVAEASRRAKDVPTVPSGLRPESDRQTSISDDELRAGGFKRAGTVFPDLNKVLRVEAVEIPGYVLYLMRGKGEVKKVGITGTGASGFRQRMISAFSALRSVLGEPRPGQPIARWRSRKLDPFKEHAPVTIRAGQEIELWALQCRSLESMMAKEAELNQKFRPEWTKEGRA